MIVSCRQYLPNTVDDLAPGNILGYSCKMCSKALQVRPQGLSLITSGWYPFCNVCALKVIKELTLQDKTVEILMSPAFKAKLDSHIERFKKKP